MANLICKTFNQKPKRSRRRGIQVLEAILVLPILIIVSMAVFQFGVSMQLHQAVNSAAIEAAREAAKIPDFDTNDSVDMDKIEATVEEILGTHGISVTTSSGVLVIVEESSAVHSPGVACRGDVTNVKPCPTITTVTDNDLIQVTVIVRSGNTPIPNLLKTFGYDQDGRFFDGCSVSRRQ